MTTLLYVFVTLSVQSVIRVLSAVDRMSRWDLADVDTKQRQRALEALAAVLEGLPVERLYGVLMPCRAVRMGCSGSNRAGVYSVFGRRPSRIERRCRSQG